MHFCSCFISRSSISFLFSLLLMHLFSALVCFISICTCCMCLEHFFCVYWKRWILINIRCDLLKPRKLNCDHCGGNGNWCLCAFVWWRNVLCIVLVYADHFIVGWKRERGQNTHSLLFTLNVIRVRTKYDDIHSTNKNMASIARAVIQNKSEREKESGNPCPNTTKPTIETWYKCHKPFHRTIYRIIPRSSVSYLLK